MEDKYWKKFRQSGKVEDYIKYVNNYFNSIDEKQVTQNAVNNEGLDNKGTDSWGE